MRRNRRNSAKKERIIMIASSAFVLTALTMTGIYMKSNQEEQLDDGYTIDFTALENSINDKMDEIQDSQELAQNEQQNPNSIFGDRQSDLSENANLDNDLDYLPMEAGSGRIEIPGLTDRLLQEELRNEGDMPLMGDMPDAEENALAENSLQGNTLPAEEVPVMDNNAVNETPDTEGEAISPDADIPALPDAEEQLPNTEGNAAEAVLHFVESDGLLRPVSGEVLIPYSMDGTVYFSTLDQFKYNSALVLGAELGSPVLACADARVTDIFENEEIGQAVTMELGDGYQITYGQLEALNVVIGGHVEAGEVIGWIAAPTKYYCVEGSNLYLKLTAGGVPVNPEILFR